MLENILEGLAISSTSPPSKSDAPSYIYLPLEAPDEIRLLKVTSAEKGVYSYEIIHTTLQNAPQFQAVSYAWGDNTRSESLALVDSTQVPITQNLSKAIWHLSWHCDTGYLWIDQLCIDQDVISERNHQVKIMGDVYSSSARALVWLDEPEELDATLLEAFQAAESARSRSSFVDKILEIDVHRSEGTWDRIMQLLRRPWFSRAWVVQEVLLPARAFVILGSALFSIDAVFITLSTLINTNEYVVRKKEDKAVDVIYSLYIDRRIRKLSVPIHDLLPRMMNGAEASNDRDLIYAFLGLKVDNDIDIFPNYLASVEEVYTSATAAIIKGSRNLDIFSSIGERLLITSRRVPSWVPDWRVKSISTRIYSRMHSATPSKVPRACRGRQHVWRSLSHQEFLAVKGKKIDSVKLVVDQPFGVMPHQWMDRADCLNLDATIDSIEISETVKDERLARSRLLRTITANGSREHTLSRSIRQFPGIDLEDFGQMLDAYEEFVVDKIWITRSPATLRQAYLKALQLLTLPAHDRKVFMTSAGRFGLGLHMQKDDIICILHGCSTPVILRPQSTGSHIIIGDCYLEDVMRGEAVTWKEEEADDFILM
jgi:hypothetical protein